jgi:mannose-1-phosphate guanylyltransferase
VVVAGGVSVKRKPEAHAVVLAGGRGTRFWPRSRTRTPKQLLNIVGRRTMLEQTLERLAPSFPRSRIWIVTNAEQAAAVRRQARGIPAANILAEPIGRNTAAAIGLAAAHIARRSPDALMAVLPADHYIAQAARYRRIVRAALEMARRGPHLVVLGIPPTRPETGFGYIERGRRAARIAGQTVFAVRRFTEKPAPPLARRYAASGRFDWNAGMFFWSAGNFLAALEEFLPATRRALGVLTRAIGTRGYSRALRRIYPRLENISVDYAVMEPATRRSSRWRVFVVPAEVGWSDIGSWAAVYELLARRPGENVSAGRVIALDAAGNFFWSPGKLVAAIGVRDLVVVETPDALLLCPRDCAQDVGKVVKELEHRKLKNLL